jgi:predicted enzyme related to lactoylglutathione lyase
MTQITGIATVWLPVTDLSRAVDFYSGTLGLTVGQQEDAWAELKADGLTIGLNARDEETPGGEGGAVVAFTPSGELEQAVEELSGQGVSFNGEISDHPWGRIANFTDPDGNALQLYTPPKS